ncbi:unnamed protein product, partial [marine sediment metagenome]
MIEYIIIAILQGLFEWLPISSSGQVMIVAVNFFGIPPEEAYSLSIWLHLGTMFAVLLKFKKDYIRIAKSFLPKKFNIEETDIKKRNWLIVGTIGTAITALPLYFIFKFIIVGEFTAIHGDLLTLIIAGMLIITGIILLLIKKKFGVKTIESVEKQNVIKDSFIIGLTQGVAVLPGISRSAITVSTTLIENYEQDSALRLSFLMSVPVVIASIAVDIIFGEGSVFRILDPITIIIITFFSFIVGYASIEILLKIAKKIQFGYFCLLYGIIAY